MERDWVYKPVRARAEVGCLGGFRGPLQEDKKSTRLVIEACPALETGQKKLSLIIIMGKVPPLISSRWNH